MDNSEKPKIFSKKVSWTSPNVLAFMALFGLAGIYLIFKLFAASHSPVAQQSTQDYVPDQILVSFKSGADPKVQQNLINRYGLVVKKDIPQIQTKVVTVNPKARDAVIVALRHNPAVKFAEKDFTANAAATPNDPNYPASSMGSGQWPHNVMKHPASWNVTTGSSSVVVADADSGIDTNHPDLAGTTVTGYNAVDGSSNTVDTSGHGEYTAGTIAEIANNSIGGAGVCWQCKLMPIKVTNTTTASYSAIAAGITWATDHGAKVINLSYGPFCTSSSSVNSAVTYATSHGSIVVNAAGNSGTNCTNILSGAGAVVVAASDQSDNLMSYSEWGSSVQVAAPTSQITTWLKDPATGTPYGYGPVGGTSISAPMVAGAVALMRSAKPSATVDQIKQALFSTTDPLTGKDQSGVGKTIQYGRVNTYNALQSLLGGTLPPLDTTRPTVSITSPANNASVSGQISVNVSASDNVGVQKVVLYVNNLPYATSTSAPYSFYLDTTKYPNNSQINMHAYAVDDAGNSATNPNPELAVFVRNSTTADTTIPTTSVTAPANGATVSGSNVTVSATSSDNVGVTSTEVYIDGLLRGSSGSGSASFGWDTTMETNGSHTILSKAYDAAGNVGTSSTVTITVSNASDTVAPTVTITSPADGAVASGRSVTIDAAATDNTGVTKMEVYVDGSLKATGTSSSITYKWALNKQVTSGSHVISVKAYDAAGNIGIRQISVTK